MLGNPKYVFESGDTGESRHLGYSDSVGRIVVKFVNSPSEDQGRGARWRLLLDI
jgi:hypothetical protein